MILRPGEAPGNGIAVFPFLKTSQPIRLGGFTFRSTDDIDELSEADSAHVREIAEMLFLRDDLRIRSAVYAKLPPLDLDKPGPPLAELEHIQAIIAYCYSAPHPTLGDLFFHFEQTSLAIFSPQPVLSCLVREEHHVEPTNSAFELKQDEWQRVTGYEGRYNFRQPFWVAKGSRLYPPVPHMSLNINQDLASDLDRFLSQGSPHHLLRELLWRPATEIGQRVLTALAWYNRANAFTTDDTTAIIHLAVAFEALLGLPRDAKTDRFVDAVSLLLGRVARLDVWAQQFYAARSDVAHEGTTARLHFVPSSQKNSSDTQSSYQSLLAYGRQIFQLCVGTVIFGAHLGARAGHRDKLVTNQERFEFICRTLNDESLTPRERFAAIHDAVALTDEFRFVRETGLLLETMVGAVKTAARNLLLCDDFLEPLVRLRMEALSTAKRSADLYEGLEALGALHDFRITGTADRRSPLFITRRLVEVVWHYTFMHYFWLKRQRDQAQQANSAI